MAADRWNSQFHCLATANIRMESAERMNQICKHKNNGEDLFNSKTHMNMIPSPLLISREQRFLKSMRAWKSEENPST